MIKRNLRFIQKLFPKLLYTVKRSNSYNSQPITCQRPFERLPGHARMCARKNQSRIFMINKQPSEATMICEQIGTRRKAVTLRSVHISEVIYDIKGANGTGKLCSHLEVFTFQHTCPGSLIAIIRACGRVKCPVNPTAHLVHKLNVYIVSSLNL